MSTPQQFQHRRLESPHHIRLLRVHSQSSGNANDKSSPQIQGKIQAGNVSLGGYLVHSPGLAQPSIEIVHVDLNDAPVYEAVSYTWGALTQVETIILRNHEESISITSSLALGLPYLARNCLTGYLWIDQICINQDDDFEKSAQLPLMGRIYREAVRALTWLNPDLRLFQRLDRFWHSTQHSRSSSVSIRNAFRADHDLVRIYKSSIKQHESPWYERGWVVQEFSLAKDVLLLERGNSIGVESLAIIDQTHLPRGFANLLKIRISLENEIQPRHRSLMSILFVQSLPSKTERLYDRIFAFLGIWCPPGYLPSYDRPLEMNLEELTYYLAQSSGCLDMLGSASTREVFLSHDVLTMATEMPTWVLTPLSLRGAVPLSPWGGPPMNSPEFGERVDSEQDYFWATTRPDAMCESSVNAISKFWNASKSRQHKSEDTVVPREYLSVNSHLKLILNVKGRAVGSLLLCSQDHEFRPTKGTLHCHLCTLAYSLQAFLGPSIPSPLHSCDECPGGFEGVNVLEGPKDTGWPRLRGSHWNSDLDLWGNSTGSSDLETLMGRFVADCRSLGISWNMDGRGVRHPAELKPSRGRRIMMQGFRKRSLSSYSANTENFSLCDDDELFSELGRSMPQRNVFETEDEMIGPASDPNAPDNDDLFEDLLPSFDNPGNDELFSELSRHLWQRSVFETEDGMIGLASDLNALDNDHLFGSWPNGERKLAIHIVHGCNVPLLLRREDPEENKGKKVYRVLTECYLHGAMNGEAVTWEETEAEDMVLI